MGASTYCISTLLVETGLLEVLEEWLVNKNNLFKPPPVDSCGQSQNRNTLLRTEMFLDKLPGFFRGSPKMSGRTKTRSPQLIHKVIHPITRSGSVSLVISVCSDVWKLSTKIWRYCSFSSDMVPLSHSPTQHLAQFYLAKRFRRKILGNASFGYLFYNWDYGVIFSAPPGDPETLQDPPNKTHPPLKRSKKV